MKCKSSIQTLSLMTVSAIGAATCAYSDASGAVLYSNLQGNYTSQQTSSYTINKGSYSAAGYSSDFDAGSTGFGDDYSVDPSIPTTLANGVASVPLQSVSFYGDAEPSPGNPPGSLGATVTIYFFNSSKTFVPVSVSANTWQGTGLHTMSFSSINIPANGYIVFSPGLYSTYNLKTGTSTPLSYGTVSLTGYFGAAPTVGLSNSTSFASTDTNRQLSTTAAQANSPAYLQIELDSTPTPEPASLGFLGAVAYGLLGRRQTQA